MLFASFDYLLFFTVAFTVYWALAGHRVARLLWIVATSYFFYAAGPKPTSGPLPTPWHYVGLLVLSTVVDWWCALRIDQARTRAGSTTNERAGHAWIILSLTFNLGLLGYLKYTGFLFEVFEEIAALGGRNLQLPVLKLLLPVGISFYTFQSLSYTIDVYRGTLRAKRSLLDVAFFLAFFPQLVAGPIVRAAEFFPQMAGRPALQRQDVDFALSRIGQGLIKKVVFGDFIAASMTDAVFAAPTTHSSLENLLALYAFTLQIYADFSGYSDIAIGSGRLLGFRLPENFNRPYQAVNVSDFWRRWHITLSTWLRDYVYFPLGGSRKGTARSLFNLWVTMFLVGIWHGASWNFVIYATLQATAMVYHRVCQLSSGSRFVHAARLLAASSVVGLGVTALASVALDLRQPEAWGLIGFAAALLVGLLPDASRAPLLRPLHIFLTFHFCVLSRIFFRAEDLDSARAMAARLLNWDGLGVRPGWFQVPRLVEWLEGAPSFAPVQLGAQWGVLLLLVTGFALHLTRPGFFQDLGRKVVPRTPALAVGFGLAVLMGLLSLLLSGPRPNIYFAF